MVQYDTTEESLFHVPLSLVVKFGLRGLGRTSKPLKCESKPLHR